MIKDFAEAYTWLNVAVVNGQKQAAEYCNKIKEFMTQSRSQKVRIAHAKLCRPFLPRVIDSR